MPSNDIIDEIRARVDIVELVGRYVRLQRSGKNWRGLCPFHAEKTPSFYVTPVLSRFHCFGCSEAGDVFSFMQKVENLDFQDALRRLAERAGVQLPASSAAARQAGKTEERYRVMATAAAFYELQLQRTPAAVAYLNRRGVCEETIVRFNLGFAPDAWEALAHHLGRQGVKLSEAQKLGLVEQSRDGGYYDRFRNRVTFPIHDGQGRVIAFGGRAMGDAEPKYLNSPETPLFQKRATLYGLHSAKAHLLKSRVALLVEGYLDVIACVQYGFENSLATLGTSLSEDHAKLLKRWTDRVVVLYDADTAGVTAAVRAAETLEPAGVDVRIAQLGEGEDPDSALRSHGVAVLKDAIAGAQPLAAFQLRRVIARHDPKADEGATALFREAVPIIAAVDAAVERERLIQELTRYSPTFALDAVRAEEAVRRDVSAAIRRNARLSRGVRIKIGETLPELSVTTNATPKAVLDAERTILRAVCTAEFRADLWQWADVDHLESPAHQSVAREMRQAWGEAPPDVPTDVFVGRLENEDARKELTAILLNDQEPITDKWLHDCLSYLIERRRRQEAAALRRKLTSSDSNEELRDYQRLITEAHSPTDSN